MNGERELGGLQRTAEWTAWRLDDSGVLGVGTDGSGIVTVRLGDAGQVRQVEVGRGWWRDVGPEGLSAAILDAMSRAANDRLVTWSERVAEREASQPPVDWLPSERQPVAGGSQRSGIGDVAEESDRAEELMRMLDMLRAAMSELDSYRQRADDQARQPVEGRGEGGRVTVSMTAGQVTGLEISRRWLHEQPAGRVIADEIETACRDAYRQMELRSAATLATSPAVTEVRDLVASPTALLRRLGLGG